MENVIYDNLRVSHFNRITYRPHTAKGIKENKISAKDYFVRNQMQDFSCQTFLISQIPHCVLSIKTAQRYFFFSVNQFKSMGFYRQYFSTDVIKSKKIGLLQFSFFKLLLLSEQKSQCVKQNNNSNSSDNVVYLKIWYFCG